MSIAAAPRPVVGVLGRTPLGRALLQACDEHGVPALAVDPAPGAAGPASLADVEVLIEAVPDTLPDKQAALQLLGRHAREDAVVVTTSSRLPLAVLAAGCPRPGAVVGLAFGAPPGAGGRPTVVPTAMTAPAVTARLEQVLAAAGIVEPPPPTAVRPPRPPAPARDVARGLVLSLAARAVALADEGYATPGDIDRAMRLGCGFPAGPIALLASFDPAAARADVERFAADVGLADPRIEATLRRWTTGPRPDAASPAPAGAPEATDRPAPGRIGVVGSGALAEGIAEVTIRAGLPTMLVTADPAAAAARLNASLVRAVRRGIVDVATRDRALTRLTVGEDVGALDDCDLVIEAAGEDLAAKQQALEAIDAVCKPGTVLATTTSTLTVDRLAQGRAHPQDLVGLHFLRPVPVVPVVEVVHGPRTGEAARHAADAFCRAIGRTPVRCPDRPGLIVDSLVVPYLNDAARALDLGVEIEDVDRAVEVGFGHPLGPFRLLDVVGLDVVLTVQQRLYEAFGAPRLAPAPVLGHLVGNGLLGRATSAGFYHHTTPHSVVRD